MTKENPGTLLQSRFYVQHETMTVMFVHTPQNQQCSSLPMPQEMESSIKTFE
jgi:hypothetical protein